MATLLVYSIAPYVPFTKILSASINQDKADIRNRLNWAGGTNTATGLGDDNIQSNTASAETAATLTLGGVTYTATTGQGADGNSVTIAYTGGGNAGSEVVSVTGQAISVQIQSGVSTITQVRTAVNAAVAAAALVIATGTSATTVSTASATNLAGGVSASGVTRSTKLGLGQANAVVINDSSGKMSSESFLARSRGGLGTALTSTNPGDVILVGSSGSFTTGAVPTPAANRVYNFYTFY